MTMPLANDARDTDKFWLALALSLLLHAGLYYLVPYLQSRAVTPLERIEIVLDTALQPAAPAPAPTPPAPPPVKAEPVPDRAQACCQAAAETRKAGRNATCTRH